MGQITEVDIYQRNGTPDEGDEADNKAYFRNAPLNSECFM